MGGNRGRAAELGGQNHCHHSGYLSHAKGRAEGHETIMKPIPLPQVSSRRFNSLNVVARDES